MLIGIIIGIVIAGIAAAIIIVMLKNNAKKDLEQTKELMSANAAAEHSRLETELNNSNRRISDLTAENNSLKDEKKSLQTQNTNLQISLQEANTRLEEQNDKNEQLKAEREEQQKQQMELLRQQFENTSRTMLQQRQEEFAKANSENMGNIVTPLRNELENMRKQLSEAKSANDKNISSLEGALKNMIEQSQAIGKNADNLADALKNRGKVHGDWGEQVLANILSSSGLREGIEFSCQESFKGEKGNELRPDVVVNCADGSRIIIDSKVSLTAYSDYNGAENEEERKATIKANYESVFNHVKELAAKNYPKYVDNSIKYVMMFIPNEGSYILATNYKSSLSMEAFRMGVIILNPTNLMLALHLVLQTWHNSRQEDNCQNIINAANNMYDKFVTFADNYNTLGNQLDTVKRTYDKAMGQLQTGNANLLKQMDSLRNMGVNTTKRIKTREPKSLTQNAESVEIQELPIDTEAQDL